MARRLITQADEALFRRLHAKGLTNREIAAKTGFSYGAVQDYTSGRRSVPLVRPSVVRDAAYQTPPRIETDDAKHLKAVIAHGGFTWKTKGATA